MKHILLGTALLALAALCGQPARADGTYTPIVSGVTPQSGGYPINVGYYGSNTTDASIPISVAALSAQVTGAAPSRTIYVGWAMDIRLGVKMSSGSQGITLDSDSSAGLTPVVTQPDGTWTHPFNGSGSYAKTFTTDVEGGWTIYAGSTITDPAGNNKTLVQGGSFTTYKVYTA